MLAASYWRQVEATTHRSVRADAIAGHIDVPLFGRGPVLVRLGRRPPRRSFIRHVHVPHRRRAPGRPAGGALALEQVNGDPDILRSTLTEYVPRLAGTPYLQVRARLDSLISRRYFARLGRDAR